MEAARLGFANGAFEASVDEGEVMEELFPVLMGNAGEANQKGDPPKVNLSEQKPTLAEKLGIKVARQPAGTSTNENPAIADVKGDGDVPHCPIRSNLA